MAQGAALGWDSPLSGAASSQPLRARPSSFPFKVMLERNPSSSSPLCCLHSGLQPGLLCCCSPATWLSLELWSHSWAVAPGTRALPAHLASEHPPPPSFLLHPMPRAVLSHYLGLAHSHPRVWHRAFSGGSLWLGRQEGNPLQHRASLPLTAGSPCR